MEWSHICLFVCAFGFLLATLTAWMLSSKAGGTVQVYLVKGVVLTAYLPQQHVAQACNSIEKQLIRSGADAINLSINNVSISRQILDTMITSGSMKKLSITRLSVQISVGPLVALMMPSIRIHVLQPAAAVELSFQQRKRGGSLPNPKHVSVQLLKEVEKVLWPPCTLTRWCVSIGQALRVAMAPYVMFLLSHVSIHIENASLHVSAPKHTASAAVTSDEFEGVAMSAQIGTLTVEPAACKRKRWLESHKGMEVMTVIGGVGLLCQVVSSGRKDTSKLLQQWRASVKTHVQLKWQQRKEWYLHCSSDVSMKSILLHCNAPIFHTVKHLCSILQHHSQRAPYQLYRPSVPVSSNPQAWWRYAGKSVLMHVCALRQESPWPVHQLCKLPAYVAWQKEGRAKGVHWDGDYQMTERQCCSMRFLAWCVTRHQSSQWADNETRKRWNAILALLMNIPDTRKWRCTTRVQVQATCPRVVVSVESVHRDLAPEPHVMEVSLGGISYTGTLDRTAFEQLRSAQMYMDVAVQVDSLKVAHIPPSQCDETRGTLVESPATLQMATTSDLVDECAPFLHVSVLVDTHQNTVHSMIQAGSLDVRYPCTTVNQILSSNWVQFPVSWATDEDEQNLIPGLKTCVINSLKEGGSARVSAALVADGATPTVLHAGPMNLCIILDDAEEERCSHPQLHPSDNDRPQQFTSFVLHIPLLRIAHGTETRSHPSPDLQQLSHGEDTFSLFDSLHSVASPRIAAVQDTNEAGPRPPGGFDRSAQHVASVSKSGSKNGSEMHGMLTIQAQIMASWHKGFTDVLMGPGSKTHPVLQDVSLFINMMDCSSDASSQQTYLHVSVHPLVTLIVAPDSVKTLKVMADAVSGHLDLVKQNILESAPELMKQEQDLGLSMTHTVNLTSGKTRSVAGKPTQSGTALAGSLCTSEITVLLSSSSVVASSHATAEDLVSRMDSVIFQCTLDGVYLNVMCRPGSATACACINGFHIQQHHTSTENFREGASHRVAILRSQRGGSVSKARKLRTASEATWLSALFGAWSRTTQLSKFMTLARSCPALIGWLPKPSMISKAALCSSITATTDNIRASVNQAGFTVKLTPEEGRSLKEITEKLQAPLQKRQEPQTTAKESHKSTQLTPLSIKIQLNHIKLLIYSPSQPSVLSMQTTLLDVEAHVALHSKSQSVSARTDSFLVTDKRALTENFRSIVAMLPKAGGSCLHVNFISHLPALLSDNGANQTCGEHLGPQMSIVCDEVLATCVNRSIMDLAHYLAMVNTQFHNNSSSSCDINECASDQETRCNEQIARLAVMISICNCCILIPETGWSRRVFALTTPYLLFAPLSGSNFFFEAKQLSLLERWKNTATQRLVFEQHSLPGSVSDVAQQLTEKNSLSKDSISKRMCRKLDAVIDGCCHVLVMDSPIMYWMCQEQSSMPMTHYRPFARGNSLVAAVERPGVDGDMELTIAWPYQQLLAGECQFSQLMRTIFGNLGESGFDAVATSGLVVPLGSAFPVPSAPADMNVPPDADRKVCTNVEMKETVFLTEALCHEPEAGHGTRLAELRLWNAKVQHVLMDGVCPDNLCVYRPFEPTSSNCGGAQHIVVTSQELRICRSADPEQQEQPVAVRESVVEALDENEFAIIRAGKSKAIKHQDVTHAPAALQQPMGSPAQRFRANLVTVRDSNGFLLDYVIHGEGGVQGSHCIEVVMRTVDLIWPNLHDLSIVWQIVEVYSHFVFIDFVCPFIVDPACRPWFFVNVVLTEGNLLAICPRPGHLDKGQTLWVPTLLFQWDKLRIGYDWAGKRESILIVNAEGFSAKLLKDVQPELIHSSWRLRSEKWSESTLLLPFDLFLRWEVSQDGGVSPGETESLRPESGTGTAARSNSGFATAYYAGDESDVVSETMSKSSLHITCSELQLHVATSISKHLKSFSDVLKEVLAPSVDAEIELEAVSSLDKDEDSDESVSFPPASHNLLPSRPSVPGELSTPGKHMGSERATSAAGTVHRMDSSVQQEMRFSQVRAWEAGWLKTPLVHDDLCGPPRVHSQAPSQPGKSTSWRQSSNSQTSRRSTDQIAATPSVGTSASEWNSKSSRPVGRNRSQSIRSIQVAVQTLEMVLVDDKYQSEKIPSVSLKAGSLSTTWSHDCTLLSPRSWPHVQPEVINERNHGMVRAAISCNYFNSSLDVEEALLLEWPISVTYEHLPIQNVKVLNVTSEETMMLRLSAACFDSIKDALLFADSLQAQDPVLPAEDATSCDTVTNRSSTQQGMSCKPHHSSYGCVSSRQDCELGQMFKIVNSTGLGLACYKTWADSAERMDLSSTAQTTDLKFQPRVGMVYLPDLARKVLSRVISVQLESSFIGSIRPIEEVVVDKVGLYAYPMQTHGRQQLYSWSTFQNALVVSVHLEHRTKIVHVHTPYKLVNKCPLLLRFKLQVKSRRSEAALSRMSLNPVIQLPVRSRSQTTPSCLARDEGCFLPVTALAEQPQIIKMYFSASTDNKDMDHAQSDCIELHSEDISKQQGLYKCTTDDATHFVCLKINCQPVQAMTHELGDENDDLCNKLQQLQFCTFEFVPPLIVTSALPCTISADIVARDSTDSVCFELKPGQCQEICAVNTGCKWLNFGVQVPGMRRTEVSLPRKDGFTKELQLHSVRGVEEDDCNGGTTNAVRMLFSTRVADCGQIQIDIFSPVWIMNKSGISIDVMIPRWQTFYTNSTCLTQEESDVVSCQPAQAADEQPKLQMLGYSGSQSLRISSGGASIEADHLIWKRVSVASIGLKGPLSLQLPLPQPGSEHSDTEKQYAQETLNLMQGWTWITKGCEETDPSIARYDVNVHVAIGSHPFASSKLVTFAPAVVLCNASNATMNVQQYHSNKLLTLQPGSSRPLIWFNPDAKSELLVQPVCEGVLWNWSGRFTVSEVCTHALRIHSKNDPSHFTILPVSVSMQGYSLVCVFNSTKLQHAPYQIENVCSNHVVCIRQKESVELSKDKDYFKIMPQPGARLPFAWDDTINPHKLGFILLPKAEADAPPASLKNLANMEHELNIDKSVDMRVPLRKIGRVAAFRKGLKHTGYNLVRTVADMQNIAQLLDWDRSVEDGVQEEKQVEQTVRVTVHSEGPTHIVRFDDNEASVCDGDVIQHLARLRQEVWRIDSVLRRYQDEKGILIDILLAAHDSQAAGQNSLQFTMSEDEFRPYAQSAFGGSTRSASIAIRDSRLDSMYSPSAMDHASHGTVMHEVAIAEGAEGNASRSSANSSAQGSTSSRALSKMTAWTFERNSSMHASGAEPVQNNLDTQRDAASSGLAYTMRADHSQTSEDHQLVNWVQSLPTDLHDDSTNPLQAVRRRTDSRLSQAAAQNSTEPATNRRVVFWQGSQKFGSWRRQRSTKDRETAEVVPAPRSIRSSDNRSQGCSSREESVVVSETTRKMEGTLSVQLLNMSNIKVGKRVRWSGAVQVVLQCETLGDNVRTYTIPRLQVSGGQATFSGDDETSATALSKKEIPSEFVFRKVPMSGVLKLTLCRLSALGLKAMAKAYLHLDQAQHQEDGGRDVEHTVTWHPVSGAANSMGSLTLHAFWMSTEQERLEMELMTTQAELQKKYELLAQLEERYGEDIIGDEGGADAGHAALDWQENGDLTVQVIEGSMLKLSKRKSTRVSVKLTIHGKQGYGKTKSTAWASGRSPWWSETIGFQHCQRRDVMVVQVFELHRFGADLLLGQCLLPLHNLPRGGRPRYQWVEILDNSFTGSPESGTVQPALGASANDAAGRNLVHLRLAWSDHHQQSSYCAYHVVLRGIGFSVIDSLSRRIARELAFIHLMDVQVHYRQDMGGQRTGLEDSEAAARNSELSVSLQNFQVDNQLLNASMPVVICRRERQLIDRGGGNQGLLKAAQREIERQRQGAPLLTLQCRVMLSNIRKTTEDSVVIKDLHIHLDPVEVCLEETFVEALLKFGSLLPLRDLRPDAPTVDPETDAEKVLRAMLQSAEDNTNLRNHSTATSVHRWFFEKLTVDAITVHLTFLPSQDRHKRGNSTLLHVAVATGLSMSDLDDIRISLAGFHLCNKLTNPSHLMELISGHFVRQMWGVLHNLVGHVKIIGSTIALGSSILSGAWYILYQPYYQVRAGSAWSEVAHVVFIGSSRFVAEVGASFFVLLGQITGVMGMGMQKIAYGQPPMDNSLRRKPQSLTHAVLSGTALVSAAGRAAVKNFVLLPKRGWQERGVVGAMAGSACGVSGLLLPLGACFDLMARTMFGIGVEIEMLGSTGRWRATSRGPRRNHGQAIIMDDRNTDADVSDDASKWVEVLKRSQQPLAEERVIDWIQNKAKRTLVLTEGHIIYCQNFSKKKSRIKWSLDLQHISSIITVGHTVVIAYSEQYSMGAVKLEVPSRHMIACDQEAVVEVVMQKVNRILDEHFDKRYVKGNHNNRFIGCPDVQTAPPQIPWSLYADMDAHPSMAEARHALKPPSTAGALEQRLSKISSTASPTCGKSSMSGHSHMSGRGFRAAVAHLKQSKMTVTAPISAAGQTIKAKLQQVKTTIQGKLGRASLVESTTQQLPLFECTFPKSSVGRLSTLEEQSTEVTDIALLVRDKLASAKVGEHAGALLYARMRLDGLLHSARYSGWDEHIRLMVQTARDVCDVHNDAQCSSTYNDVVMNSCAAVALAMNELVSQCRALRQEQWG